MLSVGLHALTDECRHTYLEDGFRFLCRGDAGSSDDKQSRERYSSHCVRRTETRISKERNEGKRIELGREQEEA